MLNATRFHRFRGRAHYWYLTQHFAVDRDAHVANPGPMKIREILRLLRADGWEVVRTRESHRQLKHPLKAGLVTVAGSPNDDLAPATLNSIFKQAGLEP